MEVNGVAEAIARLDLAKMDGEISEDLYKELTDDLKKFCKYVRYYFEKGPIFWHEFKQLKGDNNGK